MCGVMNPMIRPYAPNDLEPVLAIWHRASVTAHPFLSEQFLADERSQIAERWLPVAETFVCEIDGRVAGFLSLVGNEVGGLFVDPHAQRRGIGRALMDVAAAARPLLELDVFEANSGARSFYDAYGFVFVNRHLNEDVGQFEIRLRFGEAGEVE